MSLFCFSVVLFSRSFITSQILIAHWLQILITALQSQNTITDIFDEKPAVKMDVDNAQPMSAADIKREQEDFERTLVQVEEETDVTAARMARAEVSADLAEFDENIPYQVSCRLSATISMILGFAVICSSSSSDVH